ncbi:YceK/YidQ family lipoprotein [Lonsdalea quercina]|uniref:YceK/YidQ family lipoprotein n=1 Tax=Lonsdalea quercina TaxID=71657 RepID=UPI003976A20A
MTILKSVLSAFVLAVGIVIALSGCSSVMTRTGGDPGYYSGTRAGIDMLEDDHTSWAMMPLVAIDIPFSAALDTLLLPYDYYHFDDKSLHDRVSDSEGDAPFSTAPATPTIASQTRH